jgi:hypothetical protein
MLGTEKVSKKKVAIKYIDVTEQRKYTNTLKLIHCLVSNAE